LSTGQAKADLTTQDELLEAATDLKRRFPMLQIEAYNAEMQTSEKIEFDAAA
jgi:hypothetical protein